MPQHPPLWHPETSIRDKVGSAAGGVPALSALIESLDPPRFRHIHLMFSHLFHLLRSRTRHRAGRRNQVELITDARQSPLENWQYRRTMYNWLQGSRIPILLTAGAVYWLWENWVITGILFLISVPLPWIAVVIANGVGQPRDPRRPQIYKPQVAREQARQAAHAALESGKQKELPGVVDHNTDGDTAEH